MADEAGLTTGAIYHYFDSKLAIYVAVYQDAREQSITRFEKAIVGLDSFAEQLSATLEAAYEINTEDPTLAQFLGSSRVDAERNPILRDALRGVPTSSPSGFFRQMVAFGVETGEIDAKDAPLVESLIRTITVGLTDAVSSNPVKHRQAIDGINRLLTGSLITPAS